MDDGVYDRELLHSTNRYTVSAVLDDKSASSCLFASTAHLDFLCFPRKKKKAVFLAFTEGHPKEKRSIGLTRRNTSPRSVERTTRLSCLVVSLFFLFRMIEERNSMWAPFPAMRATRKRRKERSRRKTRRSRPRKRVLDWLTRGGVFGGTDFSLVTAGAIPHKLREEGESSVLKEDGEKRKCAAAKQSVLPVSPAPAYETMAMKLTACGCSGKRKE